MFWLVIPTYIETGGAETLFLRIGRAYARRGETVTFICRDMAFPFEEEVKAAGIGIKKIYGSELKDTVLKFHAGDSVLTSKYVAFCEIEYWRKRFKVDCRVILYILGKEELDPDSRLNNSFKDRRFLYPLRKSVYRKTSYRYARNGNIIFMDEETRGCTEKALDYHISGFTGKPFRVPVEFSGTDVAEPKKRGESGAFRLLSISRADFPFKGYLKGLIETYSELKKKYKGLNLTVISSGPHYDELEKWVNEAKRVGADIRLIQGAKNSELPGYYRNCDLYVGMGTTLIEAAMQKVPSVVVEKYTYSFRSDHFFNEKPEDVGAYTDNLRDGAEYIEKTINMSDEGYKWLAEDSYRKAKDIYSMETFIKRFDALAPDPSSYFIDSFYEKAYIFKNRIKRKLGKQFEE